MWMNMTSDEVHCNIFYKLIFKADPFLIKSYQLILYNERSALIVIQSVILANYIK